MTKLFPKKFFKIHDLTNSEWETFKEKKMGGGKNCDKFTFKNREKFFYLL